MDNNQLNNNQQVYDAYNQVQNQTYNYVQQDYGQTQPAYAGQQQQAYVGQTQPAYNGQPQQTYTGQTQPAYNGQPQQAYAGQPQPAYGGQQMYGGQPQQAYGGQQMYGGQQAYAQPKANKVNVADSIKGMTNEFTGKVKTMGLSLFCLLGIIGAMLLIMVPFMNFTSIHVNENVKEDEVSLKVKASDGFTLFELSKLSNTTDRGVELYQKMMGSYSSYGLGKGVSKDTLADMLDAAEDSLLWELQDELDQSVKKSSAYEVFGTVHLLLKGQGALAVTPWLIMLSGIGLLIFAVINRKIPKLICAGVSLACLIWLMVCSSHFFSIIGIGAVALMVGIIFAVVSAILDKPAYQ